jgi:hypothetical protein
VEGVTAGVELETLPSITATDRRSAKSSMRAVRRTMNDPERPPAKHAVRRAAKMPGPGEPGFAAPNK